MFGLMGVKAVDAKLKHVYLAGTVVATVVQAHMYELQKDLHCPYPLLSCSTPLTTACNAYTRCL